VTPTWDQAGDALAWLRGRRTAAELLVVLWRLRFVERCLLGRLLGVSPSGASAQVVDLLTRGMVAELPATTRLERSSALLRLTDLGVAVLAQAWDEDPRRLAARARLRRSDLLAAAAGLPAALDARRLLASLAGARPGRVSLLDWREPWVRPAATGRGRLTAAAYAAISWARPDGPAAVHGYLLVPDRGPMPIADVRALARGLSDLRDGEPRGFPLVVLGAPNEERLREWEEVLANPHPARRAAPLDCALVGGGEPLAGDLRPDGRSGREDRRGEGTGPVERGRRLVWGPGRPLGGIPRQPRSPADAGPCSPPRPGRAIPRPVGELPGRPPPAGAPLRRRVGHAALSLTGRGLRLLDWIGSWPFAAEADLARLADLRPRVARAHRDRLVDLGLVRPVERWEVAGFPADAPFPPLAELTRAGALLVAAHHHLPLRRAKARLGLSGGGAARPFGQRGQLLRQLAHTQAVVAVLGALAEALRRAAAAGADGELIECRNTRACGAGPFRPDAHLRYRHQGVVRELFLELEHGTARGKEGYPKKFRQYHAHYAARHAGPAGTPAGTYDGPPVLFLVDHQRDPVWAAGGRTIGWRRWHASILRDRIAREARAWDATAGRRLPVYLATLLDVVDDPEGLAGAVCRRAGDPTPVRLPLPPTDLTSLVAGRVPEAVRPAPGRATSCRPGCGGRRARATGAAGPRAEAAPLGRSGPSEG
jgi:hypothetical protein